MKTEFLEQLIPESVEGRSAIIKRIFAENGRDVNAQKEKYADYGDIKKRLSEAQAMIAALQDVKNDNAVLRAEAEVYKAAEQARLTGEKAAEAHSNALKRFDRLVGERKFVHELVHRGISGEFEEALADPANEGKSDKEIFDSLTAGRDCFVSQNAPGGGTGGVVSCSKNATGISVGCKINDPRWCGDIYVRIRTTAGNTHCSESNL